MISQKIAFIREELGMSQKDFATHLNISHRTLQNYEYGNTSPTYDFLKKLSSQYEIPMQYFMDDSLDDTPPAVHNKKNNEDTSIASSDQDINISFYRDHTASAGFGMVNYDTATDQITVSKDFLRLTCGLISFNDLSIIICSGNSMSPTLSNGDFLIAQQNTNTKDGEIFIVEYDGQIFVKRMQKYPHIRLISDNKEYPPIDIKDQEEIRIIAKVVGSIKGTSSLLNHQ